MRYFLIALLPLILALPACGKRESASSPGTEASESTAAPAAPAAPAAAADEETVTYDAIDTAKLQNTWWEQFNRGG